MRHLCVKFFLKKKFTLHKNCIWFLPLIIKQGGYMRFNLNYLFTNLTLKYEHNLNKK